jgi:hypothetical protein
MAHKIENIHGVFSVRSFSRNLFCVTLEEPSMYPELKYSNQYGTSQIEAFEKLMDGLDKYHERMQASREIIFFEPEDEDEDIRTAKRQFMLACRDMLMLAKTKHNVFLYEAWAIDTAYHYLNPNGNFFKRWHEIQEEKRNDNSRKDS